MSDAKDQRAGNQEAASAKLSQWQGDNVDSTAKLPLHKDTRDEEEQRLRDEEQHISEGCIASLRGWWLGLSWCFFLSSSLGYLPRHTRDEETKKEAESQKNAVPVVEVMQVTEAPPANDLTVPGTTTPFTQANIYARSSGYLKRRYVDIGDRVHQGQLLAVIDAPDLDQQVDQARASLRQAQSQLAQATGRSSTLHELRGSDGRFWWRRVCFRARMEIRERPTTTRNFRTWLLLGNAMCSRSKRTWAG